MYPIFSTAPSAEPTSVPVMVHPVVSLVIDAGEKLNTLNGDVEYKEIAMVLVEAFAPLVVP